MSMQVVNLGRSHEQVDLGTLPPRIRLMVELLLRDAQMIDVCASGHVSFHFTRQGVHETVRPRLTMNPPKMG